MQGSLLRTERGHGAKAVVGIVRPARAEPELAVVPEEERRAREAAIGARSVFITGAVDTDVFVLGEAFRMRQDHDPDREGSEAELIGLEDLTSATSGTSTMTQTELRGNHEDVVIRLFGGELLEDANRTLVLPEVLAAEFTIAVVEEAILAGLLQRFQHLLDGLVVGRRDGLPLRDSEPSFGVLREFCFSKLLVGVADTWEELAQNVGLLRDAFHLVTFGVHVGRLHFLVLVLVRDGQVLERFECRVADCFGEFVAVFDDTLCARVFEAELNENFLDGVGCEPVDLLDLTGRCCCLSNRFHYVISCFSELPKSPGYDLSLYETSFLGPKISLKKLVSLQ